MPSMSPAAPAVNSPVPTVAEDALADRLAFEADGGDPDTYAAGWSLRPDVPEGDIEPDDAPPIARRSFLAGLVIPACLARFVAPREPEPTATFVLYLRGEECRVEVFGPDGPGFHSIDGSARLRITSLE